MGLSNRCIKTDLLQLDFFATWQTNGGKREGKKELNKKSYKFERGLVTEVHSEKGNGRETLSKRYVEFFLNPNLFSFVVLWLFLDDIFCSFFRFDVRLYKLKKSIFFFKCMQFFKSSFNRG